MVVVQNSYGVEALLLLVVLVTAVVVEPQESDGVEGCMAF